MTPAELQAEWERALDERNASLIKFYPDGVSGVEDSIRTLQQDCKVFAFFLNELIKLTSK